MKQTILFSMMLFFIALTVVSAILLTHSNGTKEVPCYDKYSNLIKNQICEEIQTKISPLVWIFMGCAFIFEVWGMLGDLI